MGNGFNHTLFFILPLPSPCNGLIHLPVLSYSYFQAFSFTLNFTPAAWKLHYPAIFAVSRITIVLAFSSVTARGVSSFIQRVLSQAVPL
jgi:hypothetical protein